MDQVRYIISVGEDTTNTIYNFDNMSKILGLLLQPKVRRTEK